MNRKTKLIDSYEQDLVHARRVYCYLVNKINKRERRIGRREAVAGDQ